MIAIGTGRDGALLDGGPPVTNALSSEMCALWSLCQSKSDRRSLFDRLSLTDRPSSSDLLRTPLCRSAPEHLSSLNRLSSSTTAASPGAQPLSLRLREHVKEVL
jgi:hypothetical protein